MTRQRPKKFSHNPCCFYAFDFLNALNLNNEPVTIQLSAATRFLVVKTFLNQNELVQQFAPLLENHPAIQFHPGLFKTISKNEKHPIYWKTRWLAGSAAEREAVLTQLEHDLLTYL